MCYTEDMTRNNGRQRTNKVKARAYVLNTDAKKASFGYSLIKVASK